MHEVFGASASGFALMAAAQASDRAAADPGLVLWIREGWRSDQLNPSGLRPILAPDRVLMARPASQVDALAVAEEALRDGAIGFVVLEVTRPLDLREGRRLQLAARAGGTTGLCVIPEGMGSNAAETRWHAVPVFDPHCGDSTLMRWEITKNKSGTLGAWNVRWDPERHCVHVVSPVGQRPGDPSAGD